MKAVGVEASQRDESLVYVCVCVCLTTGLNRMPGHIHLSSTEFTALWNRLLTTSRDRACIACFVRASVFHLIELPLFYTLSPSCWPSTNTSPTPTYLLLLLQCPQQYLPSLWAPHITLLVIRAQKGPSDRNPKLIYQQWCHSRADRTVFLQYQGMASRLLRVERAIFVIIGRNLEPAVSFCPPLVSFFPSR